MTEQAVPTWEDIARTHGRFLFTVAYRLTGNRDDAYDLVQETLLRVHKGLRSYTPGSLEGWLSRITTNVFLDSVRAKKRRPTSALPEGNPESVLPPSHGADVAYASATLGQDIQAALNALPEEFRVAVVMCDVAGLPYQEISYALGVPVGTVRSRIHRGRHMLREMLTRGEQLA